METEIFLTKESSQLEYATQDANRKIKEIEEGGGQILSACPVNNENKNFVYSITAKVKVSVLKSK